MPREIPSFQDFEVLAVFGEVRAFGVRGLGNLGLRVWVFKGSGLGVLGFVPLLPSKDEPALGFRVQGLLCLLHGQDEPDSKMVETES